MRSDLRPGMYIRLVDVTSDSLIETNGYLLHTTCMELWVPNYMEQSITMAQYHRNHRPRSTKYTEASW